MSYGIIENEYAVVEAKEAVDAFGKIMDSVKEMYAVHEQEVQETERTKAKMKALTKMNQQRCETIERMCREFSMNYRAALEADAIAAECCRDKAHQVIMYLLENNREPGPWLGYIEYLLEQSNHTQHVDGFIRTEMGKKLGYTNQGFLEEKIDV